MKCDPALFRALVLARDVIHDYLTHKEQQILWEEIRQMDEAIAAAKKEEESSEAQ